MAILVSSVSGALAQTATPPPAPAARAATAAGPRATLYLVSAPGQTVAVGTHATIAACRIAASTAADPGNRSVVVSTGAGWIAFVCVPNP
jgi:hypothetical protein